MFEKRWAAVSPQLFTSNGTANGKLTVVDSSVFKVKQQINISSNALPNLNLEIKSIPDDVTILVGPVGANIFTYSDISAYLVADSASISAIEQKRSSVPVEEINRAVYEEEPVVATRTILVDKHGNKFDQNNPLPTTATIDVDSLTVNVTLDSFTKLPADNVVSVGTEDGTKTGIKHALNVDSELKLRVKDVEAIAELSDIATALANPLAVTGDFLTDTELRASPVPVSGPLTDTELRASPVPVSLSSGSVTINTDGFDTTDPDSMLATGSEDGTKTGVKHAVRVDSELDLRVGISDGANKAVVDGLGQLSVKDIDSQTILTSINNILSSGIVKVDDDASQSILNSILTQLSSGGIIIGTEDGTPTGVQRVFVNNRYTQILAAKDRDQDITYADFGTKDQRITRIDYIAPSIGVGVGFTARKNFTYVLDSGKYKRTKITRLLV